LAFAHIVSADGQELIQASLRDDQDMGGNFRGPKAHGYLRAAAPRRRKDTASPAKINFLRNASVTAERGCV